MVLAGARRSKADANGSTPERPGSAIESIDNAACRARYERLGLGRASRGVLESMLGPASLPVAVDPDGCADSEPRMRVIGCGFDGSPGSHAALRFAAAVARRRRARLEALLVLTEIPFGGVSTAGALGYRSANDTLHRMLEAQMRAALAETGKGMVASRVLAGDPAAQLAMASAGLDLLVLGSRGHGPVRTALFGSVSRAVVSSAHCPVVVVPRSAANP
jgi:nucleotide-binding universal stress UspA family protein